MNPTVTAAMDASNIIGGQDDGSLEEDTAVAAV